MKEWIEHHINCPLATNFTAYLTVIILIIILSIIGFFVLCSWIGAWLWNITLPYIFGLPKVEWWHILALIILLWILLPFNFHILKIGDDL
jgi:hypothetical protein